MSLLLLEVIIVDELFEEKYKRIKDVEEKFRKEETEKISNIFCSDKKKAIDSFINMLEELNHEDRLNKIKSMNKGELKKVAESLGKGVKVDVHTINCLISNKVRYNKIE